MNLRILSVRLDYMFTERPTEEKPNPQTAAEIRRDRMSTLGFDTSGFDDEAICSYPVMGMTDTQFVELTIVGEKNMTVLASVVVES